MTLPWSFLSRAAWLSCSLFVAVGLVRCSGQDNRLAGALPSSMGGSQMDEEEEADDPLTDGQGGAGGAGGANSSESGVCAARACPANATCRESGGLPFCECAPGFSGPDCADENECLAADSCEAGLRCVNTFGGFECKCPAGQIDQGAGCADISECMWGPCDEDATCTDEVDGSYECECTGGTFGNGFFCADADGCADAPCGVGECITTAAGFACKCPEGTGGPTCSAECSVLGFADPALEAAVRIEVNKPVGDLLPSDIQGISQLNLVGLDVKDLSGLECWPHLEVLDLFDTPLGDEPAIYPNALDALGALSQLQELYLGCTGVDSLDVLEGHPSLLRLGLVRGDGCGTPISDWSALETLSSLRWLDLEGANSLDLGLIQHLTALEDLAVPGAGLTDVSALSGLDSLRSLNVAGNSLTSLSALSSLPLLSVLDASENAVSSIAPVSSMRFLERLDIHDNRIEELSDLGGMDSLVFLNLSGNRIADIGQLASLGSMEWVGIAGNDVSTLEPLVDSGFMGPLFATDLPLDCEEESATLEALTSRGVLPITDCTGD